MHDLALLLAETRNWVEPFKRYEGFQSKFWHLASDNKSVPKEQYRCVQPAVRFLPLTKRDCEMQGVELIVAPQAFNRYRGFQFSSWSLRAERAGLQARTG